MEAKLAEYRAKRAKEIASQNHTSTLGLNIFKRKPEEASGESAPENEHTESLLSSPGSDQDSYSPLEQYDSSKQSDTQPSTRPSTRWNAVSIANICLQTALWLTVWAFFIHLEFGAPYLVISFLYVLYKSLRTGPKEKNKLSAYSVFNPNCERLDGTFTAEQFERELRYGPASVR